MASTMTTSPAEPIRYVGEIPLYTTGTAPAHLRSRSHLHRVLLQDLASGQVPRGYVHIRYYGTLCALYDPAEAQPPRQRSIGDAWAYRARRTCTRCRTQKPYIVRGSDCRDCQARDQSAAMRLHRRTCRACGTVGRRPFARDRDYPGWHRCPPCRAVHRRQMRQEFINGLERAQLCPECGTRVCSRTAALEHHRKARYWKRQVCEPCQAVGRQKAIDARQAALEADRRDLLARYEQIAELEQWAAEVLADPVTVVLDTETTGLHRSAKIVEIAVVTGTGETLLDALLNPGEHIPGDASAIHGITDEKVAGAPTFAEVVPKLEAALRGRRVVIYNKPFDAKRLGHELGGVAPDEPEAELANAAIRWLAGLGASAEDAMVPYSDWVGEWSEWREGYRWQRLEGGHRARGDCLAVLGVLAAMRHRRAAPAPTSAGCGPAGRL